MKTLEKEDVSVDTIQELLDEKFKDNEIDEDNDLAIHVDGVHLYVMVDEDKSVIRFNTRWQAADTLSENRAARIMNVWNNSKMFSTAYFWKTDEKNIIMLDFYITFEGGINEVNLNDSLKWFLGSTLEFNDRLKDEDAI